MRGLHIEDWWKINRLYKVALDKGFRDGPNLSGLAQHELLFVMPAKNHMTVTVDVRGQAAAGEGIIVDRRVHTVRQGRVRAAWNERLANRCRWGHGADRL